MVSVFTQPDVNTRKVGRTRDKRRKPRRQAEWFPAYPVVSSFIQLKVSLFFSFFYSTYYLGTGSNLSWKVWVTDYKADAYGAVNLQPSSDPFTLDQRITLSHAEQSLHTKQAPSRCLRCTKGFSNLNFFSLTVKFGQNKNKIDNIKIAINLLTEPKSQLRRNPNRKQSSKTVT